MSLSLLWGYFQVKILIPVVKFFQVIIIVVTSLVFTNDFYSKQATVKDGQTFDFIIVGAGTAGCVVANRLTEIPNWNVLLVEAGDDPPYVVESPGLSMITSTALPDWDIYTVNDNYSSQAQRTQNIHMIRGKGLGGSSNVNFMFYVRGNKADYDHWAALGNEGWDWNNVLKYFKKSEHLNDEVIMNNTSADMHKSDGYLQLSRPNWDTEVKHYLDSFKENGHKLPVDMNDGEQLGYGVPLFSIGDAFRQSTAVAFIRPIKNRPNLFILRNTLAKKIIFDDDKKASGVELHHPSGNIVAKAKREVILSAGTFMSPQLLMLSGIGPKEHLDELGIKTILNSPNVGRQLHDHPLVPVVITDKQDYTSFYDNFKVFLKMDHFLAPVLLGHVALNKSQKYPDYQTSFFPSPTCSVFPSIFSSIFFGWNEDICRAVGQASSRNSIFALISLLHPESRGYINLKSKDINDPPIVNNKYFSNEKDIEKLAKSVEDFISVTNTTHFKGVESEVVDLKIKECKDYVFGSHEYWKCYVLNLATTHCHPAGSCAMGPNPTDVVDEFLKLRGVKGLRIVDASVMPHTVSGNINAAVIMIAEKASDMIKLDHNILK